MSRSPERRRERLAVLVPAAVMAAIGLWGLDRGGMWRDEAVTFQVARRSVPQIWHLLHSVDAVHGLYYLLMHPVLAVRPDEVLLRLPSVCGAAVAAGLVGALGTRLCRPRVGLWAGLLYAVTPMVGHYAQEGRSYAMVAAGVMGATLLLVRAVRDGGRWWPYGLLVAVTCVLHEFAVLVLLAHACTLALARAPGKVWRGWAGAAGAVVVVLLPLVLVSHAQARQVAWLTAPDAETAGQLVEQFAGPSPGVLWPCLALVATAVWTPRGRRGVSLSAVALPLVLVPPVVLMEVSQIHPLYDDRYVLYALAGAPLLAAAGLDRVAGALGRVACTSARLRPGGRERPAPATPLGAGTAAGGPGARTPLTGPRAVPSSGDGVALAEPPRATVPPVRRDLPVPSRPGRHGVALAGVLAVGGAFLGQLPLLREDRDAAHRPDDLAVVSATVARELRPGDAVLFLPSLERRSALTYSAPFRGVRDVALEVPAAVDGTLYGQEAGPGELRRRLAGLASVWVVCAPFALQPTWTPRNATERVKLRVVTREFIAREEYARGGVILRLYVRREDRPTARP
ncbi:glycosyltransferase family 39 protein [Streptomyces nodosus]|uniref:glycosyltransferase family 39 protein n=1 Tax=Streptomyces nodosus TaxID=40318 RepID=UPI00382B1C08